MKARSVISLLAIVLLVTIPTGVYASSQDNSQTMPLLEASVNPDTNGTTDIAPITPKASPIIAMDSSMEVLVPDNSLIGPTSDLEQYASSAKINSYIVQDGDTLESIAKKFKTTPNAIIYSNADIKKSDLVTVGQELVILPLKNQKTDTLKPAPKPTPKVAVATSVVTVPPVTTLPTTSPDTSTPTLSGQPTGTIDGGYIWPFAPGIGRVSQGLHADQAYDFAAPIGTPIRAVQSGTVFLVHPTGYNGGYGKYVVINFTDGRQAIFGHMSETLVQEGQVVTQGEVIGLVGSTGASTGPHVHIGFHGPLGNPYAGLKVNSIDVQGDD